MQQRIKFFALVAMLFAAFAINAQVTTSGISGKVTDDAKAPVIGAVVTAKHVPSGTVYNAVTNIDGRYTIQGMRTGGPYTIEIAYIGFNTKQFNNIQLALGDPRTIDASMDVKSEMLSEVTILGEARPKDGAAMNFSNAQITSTPTVDRSIYDVVKNMPLVNTYKNGGVSIAGSNNRYNSFQIDGAVSNDVFGLASSGTNGGQTNSNPISMEAIQEIQVVVSPFDVRQSGFTGGGINAITKQGTNTYHASVFSYYNNQDLYGAYNAGNGFAKEPLIKQHELTIGGNVSGPIIKDKLFFFVNVENTGQSYPTGYYAGCNDSYLSKELAEKIVTRYETLTGIRDTYGKRDIEQKSFNILGRIDWNINNDNKLALRYQFNNASKDNNSPSKSTFYFNNSGYTMKNKTNSVVAELNSRIGANLFNELRASATFVRDHREVGNNGPNIYINASSGGENPCSQKLNLGTEYSSGANRLDQDVYLLEDNLSWYSGNHTITFGTHNEIFRIENLFLQAVNGAWSYNSVDDFLNDNAYQYQYKYTDPEVTGGDLMFAPKMIAGQFGIYGQDKWNITDRFQLTMGLRIDMPVILTSPTENVEFNNYAIDKGWNSRIGRNPSAKLMFSPRVGFRWHLNDEKASLLRGGVGLFTGRVPFVWISNAFNNTGVEIKGTTIKDSDGVAVPSLTQYATNPYGAAFSVTGKPISPDVVAIDNGFRYPQVLRANLALEQTLPGDIKMTLEALYSKTFNNAYFENLAISRTATTYAVEGVEASAVPFYSVDRSYASIINMSNTNRGYSYQLSAMFQKSFDFGLNATASYTFGHSKSVNDGTSSVAYSSWKYNYCQDPNSLPLTYSVFDVPNRVMVAVNYTTPKYLNGLMQSTIGLVYNGNNGMRYSLTMNEGSDYNGDGYRGNSLLYIPTDAELEKMNFSDITSKVDGQTVVTYSGADQRNDFRNFIMNDKYAKNHRGQYAERNSNCAPWENRVDLHFAQDIFILKGRGSKFQFTFDVINFANMLNKEWGVSYSSSYNIQPVKLVSVAKSANTPNAYVAKYNFTPNNAEVYKSDIYSRWHANVGFKLIF